MTATPDGAVCTHCDGSVAHQHDDGADGSIREKRRTLTRGAGLRIVILTAVVLAVTAATAGWTGLVLPVPLLSPVLAGAAGWALVTALGLLVAGALNTSGRAVGERVALALGSVAAGAATPLAALAVATLVGTGSSWTASLPTAGATAAGWATAALSAEVVDALRLRTLLLRPDRRGEQVRAAVARGAGGPDSRLLAGTLLGAAAMGTWAAALMVLPVLVVVLVPLHAALRALAARAAAPGTGRR